MLTSMLLGPIQVHIFSRFNILSLDADHGTGDFVFKDNFQKNLAIFKPSSCRKDMTMLYIFMTVIIVDIYDYVIVSDIHGSCGVPDYLSGGDFLCLSPPPCL